ncbi:hypothetical protein RND81_02G089100 [Saponaria officinalis]|uniref:Uncharacterized protein n=1 Tax=Saponaria officinalis TaxID=3572 RepID=A0AAW1MRA9_SAPOF
MNTGEQIEVLSKGIECWALVTGTGSLSPRIIQGQERRERGRGKSRDTQRYRNSFLRNAKGNSHPTKLSGEFRATDHIQTISKLGTQELPLKNHLLLQDIDSLSRKPYL